MKIDSINKQAFKEGWGIIFTGKQNSAYNIFELQKIDNHSEFGVVGSAKKFKSDNTAIKFVVKNAIKNQKSIHAKAIKFLVKNSPNEIDSMFRTALPKKTFQKMTEVLKITL